MKTKDYRMYKGCLVFLVSIFVLSACSSTGNGYQGQLRGAVFDPPRTLMDFSVMSTRGENFTLSEHRGEVTLLYFGYRACPDFCPTTFAELKRVYAELHEPADKLNIVFVTVDPERDTIENLSLYTAAFHHDFIGLRAEGQDLAALEAQFGIVAQRRVIRDDPLAYLYDHTASLFLIGANGELEAQYLYGTDYQDIVHDLQLILVTLS
jgi:protein SCO1